VVFAALLAVSTPASEVGLEKTGTTVVPGTTESSGEAVSEAASALTIWGVMSSGGASAVAVGDNVLGFTVGQPIVGISSDETNTIFHGFWQDFSAPSGPCCMNGTTGNITYDALDEVDIADLTRMVNYLFVTFEPIACLSEGNTTGDENCEVDIADLTRMVNFLFVTFEPLAACLPQCE
jgi:hypothetical protein